jgi:hypothetical protein
VSDSIQPIFDLFVVPDSSGSTVGLFRSELNSSFGSHADGTFQPPLSDYERASILPSLRPNDDARHARPDTPDPTSADSGATPSNDPAKVLGTTLFKALFSGEIEVLYRRTLLRLMAGDVLRIRLRLDRAPMLSALPWEYLYDPEEREHLGLWNRVSLVRYPDMIEDVAPLKVAPPLRVLVMIAAPTDDPTLNVEAEWQKLQAGLKDVLASGRVELDRCEASEEALERHLRDKPNVFHFIGHGMFDQATGAHLRLTDATGQGVSVPIARISQLLKRDQTMRLAVLNACETGRPANDGSLASAAEYLIQERIPAVVGMQYSVTDGAAITFSSRFYESLAQTGLIDMAVRDGRWAVLTQPRVIEWGTPVLYLHASDTQIFDIEPETEAARVDRRAATLDREAQAAHTA